MNKSFAALLQREWMQHKLGWIVVVLAPLAIALVVLAIGQVQWQVDNAEVSVKLAQLPPTALALLAIVGTAALTLVLAWFFALFQAPGLARRDQQDRSIEFWLSLPTGHVPSLAAPMLAHLVLLPLAALGIGVASGLAVSLLLVAKVAGLGEWFGLPWASILAVIFSVAARVALGIVLATVWLSPLVLLVMAASAWLKRWGLPALIATLVVVSNLLEKLYGIPVVRTTLSRLLHNAGQAILGTQQGGGVTIRRGSDIPEQLAAIPGWMAQDAGRALAALADPLLLLVLAVSAGSFWLLVLRRRRGA